MQINSLRHPEQQCILCNQKGHEAHTCDIMINYILAETAVRKDPSLKDKIIKLFKHFRRCCQFTPNNCQRINKWTPRIPKDKLSSVPKYIIHQDQNSNPLKMFHLFQN